MTRTDTDRAGDDGTATVDPTGALVRVDGLCVVGSRPGEGDVPIVTGVGFSLGRGEMLALVGEAGSGKTAIGLAMLGHARAGCHIAGGKVHVAGTEVLALDADGLRRMRGRTVAYVAPRAAAVFNPALRVIDQMVESALAHGTLRREDATAKAVDLLGAFDLPEPSRLGKRHAHELPAGHLQRVAVAMALITDPSLVVLDEPTAGLDPTTQVDVLHAIQRVVRGRNTTVLLLTRDVALAAHLADRIMVIRAGRVSDSGTVAALLDAPTDPYTARLVAAVSPAAGTTPPDAALPVPLLELRNLTAGYGLRDSRGRPAVRVLDGIDLVVRRGRAVGVIGESGSGKTTLARVVAGMVPPTPGSAVRFDGQSLPATIAARSPDQLRRIQIVFQNAGNVLNPAHRIEDVIGRPLAVFHGANGDVRRQRVQQLLDLVQLPASIAGRRGGELRADEQQRVNLARALAAGPALIVWDDVTASLDAVAAAPILDLLGALRRELGLSILFIGHDVATAGAVCDDIVVLYGGRAVETGEHSALCEAPSHPYTYRLGASALRTRAGWLDDAAQRETLPPVGASSGADLLCPYVRQCPVRIDGRCNSVSPPRRRLPGKDILCHREAAELLRWQTGTASPSA
jgi:peptide/nickel transport system ATP-binding protein